MWSKPLYTFQHFIVPSKHASCPYRMHICTPIPSEMLAVELNADDTLKVSLLFSPEDTASVISNKYVNLDSLTIEHFSTLKQSILNEPWPSGHDCASGPCSHMASFCMIEL